MYRSLPGRTSPSLQSLSHYKVFLCSSLGRCVAAMRLIRAHLCKMHSGFDLHVFAYHLERKFQQFSCFFRSLWVSWSELSSFRWTSSGLLLSAQPSVLFLELMEAFVILPFIFRYGGERDQFWKRADRGVFFFQLSYKRAQSTVFSGWERWGSEQRWLAESYPAG